MVAAQTIDLIDSAAAEAFIQLAKTTDKFERYENAHAQRVAAIADEIAQRFHLARHDRGSLFAAALLHDLGEVAMNAITSRRLDLSQRTSASILRVIRCLANAKHREWEQIARHNCWCVGIRNGGTAPDIPMPCVAKRSRSQPEFCGSQIRTQRLLTHGRFGRL